MHDGWLESPLRRSRVIALAIMTFCLLVMAVIVSPEVGIRLPGIF